MTREVPVYLLTGFLDSGKTTFINETLSDERFNDGESVLVLMCEQGDTSLLDELQKADNIHVEYLETEKKLNPVNLDRLAEKYDARKIMIEYNGMWMLDSLYNGMPENWLVYQQYCFAEADSFIVNNQSMRQLVFDKIQDCDVIVFNRFDDSRMDFMEYHKIVRAISRRADIFYEDETRDARLDEIEDPLPFDKEADSFTVEDRDYAYWYRDLSETMEDYDGKRVTVKGALGSSKDLDGSNFVFGRELMTCCVEDIQMAALVCEWAGEPIERGSWAIITGTIHIKEHAAYGNKKGPVLAVENIEKCRALEDPVATFM